MRTLSMAGGTKRLPRAVREQQMLDAAVQMFSVNGYHETSMDVIAAEAQISKPMLYLYYGSKEELFGACLNRELSRFIEAVRSDIDFKQSPHDLLRSAILSLLRYIDANRASWIVLYTQATSSQAFAHTVREGREKIIDMVARLLQVRHPPSGAGHRFRHDGRGAGGCRRGRRDPGQHRRRRCRRGRRTDDQPVLARPQGQPSDTGGRSEATRGSTRTRPPWPPTRLSVCRSAPHAACEEVIPNLL